MAVVITIGGVDKTTLVRRGSLRIQKDDAVETAELTVYSRDLTASAYRPALGTAVRVTQGTELLFGGTVEGVRDAASSGFVHGATDVQLSVVGYHLLPTQVLVTATYAAGQDAYAVYDDLCGLLSTYYGVTNIGAITGGPTLEEITWDHVPVVDALNQLNTITEGLGQGLYWRINGDKQFAVNELGTETGQTYTAANATVLRAFSWDASRLKRYTRVWTKCGEAGTGATARTQTWTGDASRTAFYLDVAPSEAPTRVYENGSPVTIGAGTWTYDNVRERLVRSTALGAGVTLSCTYTVYYPAYCRAETEAQIDAGNLYEGVFEYPDVLDLNQGVALAVGNLAQQSSTPKKVTLQTKVINPYPFQLCTLTFADRTISGNYLTRRVTLSDRGVKGTAADALIADVELWETDVLGGTWLDWWRARAGAASGGSSVSAGSSVSIITVAGVLEGDLGGSRLAGVTHSTWAPVREHRTWVCPADGTYRAFVEVWTSSGSTSVTPRIYDVTAGADAGATGASASTSTTAAAQTLTFAGVSGRSYRLELLPGNTSADVFGLGKVRT